MMKSLFAVAVAAAAASSLMNAISPFIAKRGQDMIQGDFIAYISSILIVLGVVSPTLAAAMLWLRPGTDRTRLVLDRLADWRYLAMLALSVVWMVGGWALFSFATSLVDNRDLYVLLAISSTAFVWNIAIAAVFFREGDEGGARRGLAWQTWVAMAAIVAGIAVVATMSRARVQREIEGACGGAKKI